MSDDRPVVLGFDIETASAESLYHWGPSDGPYVRLCGALDDQGEYWSTWTTTDAEEFVQALSDAGFVYGHNVFRFDIPALARHAGADFDELAAKAWDTAILERLIDPPGAKHATRGGYYGLDATDKRYGYTGKVSDLGELALEFGPRIVREGRKVFTVDRGVKTPGKMSDKARKEIGYSRIPVDDPRYVRYLQDGDLPATRRVKEETFRRVPDWAYAAREMKIAHIQNRMTFNGWRVDRELLAGRVREEAERKAQAVEVLCDRYGLPRTKADGEVSASPWSTDRGRAALEEAFHAAGAEYLPRTAPSKGYPSGKLAIGKEPMGRDHWVNPDGKRVPGMLHPDAYGNVPAVVELAEVLALATGASDKYAEIQSYLTREGRVHGGIGEDQASGRWAMTRPSLTNLGKRGPKVQQRAPFVPERGHVHLACDASQVDMRAIAGLCQDTAYMRLFEPGRDAHMEMAEVYFGERTKANRDRTKGINHGLNYMQGARAVAARNGIPTALVIEVMNERERAYPRLIEWTGEVQDQGAAGLLLDNGFGRRMRCDPERAKTQAPALMGQGAARDIVCESLIRLVTRWPEVFPYLRGVVHDEVVLSVPEDEAQLWQARLWEAFTWEWKGVPILCDVTPPGTNWAECYANE